MEYPIEAFMLEVLSAEELRKKCPVKWHAKVPKDGISLGVADTDFKSPEGVMEFIKSRLDESFGFYQQQSGLDGAIKAIRKFFVERGLRSEYLNIQVIPGTMLGIYAGMKYASRREGKIVMIGPLYEPIHRHGTDTGNELEWVPIEKDGVNLDILREKVNDETKMIAINNPSNPNGHVYTREELETIRDLVLKYDIVAFSDELYEPLTLNEKQHIPLASIKGMEDRTIALYGFSKAYGLAGYRSGFMYLGDKVSEEVKHIVEAQLVSPSPLESIVAEYALSDERSIKWVKAHRDQVQENVIKASRMFRHRGFDCDVPNGCFFIYPNIGMDDVKFSEHLLEKRGIQVVPGSVFGPTGVNHLRINCSTSFDRLEQGLMIVFEELEQLSNTTMKPA